MSFQAYLDNVEAKTGKTPQEFVARQGNRIRHPARTGVRVEAHLGPHRDASGTLKLDGKKKR